VEIRNRSRIIFLTACVRDRRPLLARSEIHRLLVATWRSANDWMVGRYILMPDHLHLFCAPAGLTSAPLDAWVRFWKSRSSKAWPHVEEKPVWQQGFWDRQLRSGESYGEKWNYVVNNPVRAGLCTSSDRWQFQGEIAEFRFHDG
jgi:putative transposase